MGLLRSLPALALAIGGAAAVATGAHAATTPILETGSSLLYPLFNLWVPPYTHKHQVEISTQSTGSGTGISEAVSGLAQIGASDAYLSDALRKQHPNILNIPLAISSQMVNYNLPGLAGKDLKLSGPVLAGIYEGKITEWDDPQIAKINSGVTLPHVRIVPIHRTDGSGDTFIFTQYLSDSTPEWGSSHSYGTTISWPTVQGGIGAEGNQGMVTTLNQTPGGVAYIGISYKSAIDQDHLGEAAIENKSGQFLTPDDQTVQAAASTLGDKMPADESVSLIFQSGAKSYPIVNFEYAIVNADMPAATATEVKNFLNWAVQPNGGNAPTYLSRVNFIQLPANVRQASEQQIDKIGQGRHG